MKRFEGTDTYVATDDLTLAVNAAITLERPLLIKGEPGTGKTMLAIEVAKALGRPLFEWHIKSTTKAQQGLYEYDAVSRLRDSQLGDARVHDIRNYIVQGMLWQAFDVGRAGGAADRRGRQGRHRVPERPAARARPHGVLRLRDAQLVKAQAPPDRVHHHQQREGAARRVPAPLLLPLHPLPRQARRWSRSSTCTSRLKKQLLREALEVFFEMREVPGLKKKPSTSELLDWLKLLLAEDIPPEALRSKDQHKIIPPLHGALLKNEQDVHLFERLVFMSRRKA